MCGRFTLQTPLKDVVKLFELAQLELSFGTRFNIAPVASMIADPSHRAVSSPANDTPQCLEPAVAGKTQGSLFD